MSGMEERRLRRLWAASCRMTSYSGSAAAFNNPQGVLPTRCCRSGKLETAIRRTSIAIERGRSSCKGEFWPEWQVRTRQPQYLLVRDASACLPVSDAATPIGILRTADNLHAAAPPARSRTINQEAIFVTVRTDTRIRGTEQFGVR